MLQALERERDRYGKEASDVQQKCIEQVNCKAVNLQVATKYCVLYII